MTINKKLKRFKRKNFSVTSQNYYMEMYPCSCCGNPILGFGLNGQDPSFHSDISNVKGVKAATAVWNSISKDDLSVSGFIDIISFFVEREEKTLAEQE